MPLSCIIFDCDGVILESVDAKAHAYARLAEPYGPEAVTRFSDYEIDHRGVSRYEKFMWFFREILNREITPEESRDWGERFIEYSDEAIGISDFVPGFKDVLARWHGRVPLYVASGTPQRYLELILRDKGVADSFARIFGTPPGKTGLVRAAVQDCGCAPGTCVMVGDSPIDLEAAIIVGTRFYGRGKRFAESGHPWGVDLAGMNEYLETMAKE